jgi:hypothetical protein
MLTRCMADNLYVVMTRSMLTICMLTCSMLTICMLTCSMLTITGGCMGE